MLVLLAHWRGLAVRGGLALLFGLITLVWPGLTLTALVLLFGAFSLVDGVLVLAGVLTGASEEQERRGTLILEGGLGVAIGIVTLVWPGITALVLLYLIAAWALVTGVLEITAAILWRRELRHEWVLGVVGALSVLFGIMLLITPGAGALVITWVIGWYAVLTGVVLLAIAWRLRQVERGSEGAAG